MKKPRIPIPKEHAEQAALMKWIDAQVNVHDGFDMAFAIPNGGARNAVTGAMLKAEGVKAGVPDVMIAAPKFGYHGLYIEMKRRNGGAGASEPQQEWIEKLRNHGYRVEVCNGCDAAIKVIKDYFRIS